MISDRRTDTNSKVLVKRVGEDLLPTPQAWGPCRPGPLVAAPHTGNSHADLFCHLSPGQTMVTELQDLLCGGRLRRSTATHGDASPLELFADGAPMNAQLGTDLAQATTLGVQVGCTRNVHRATVTSPGRISFPTTRMLCGACQVMAGGRWQTCGGLETG